jgi:adenylate cyclase class 2
MIEHEVKLRFPDVEAARHAVERAGGRLVVSRRLLDDHLFDHPTLELRRRQLALRLRRDGGRAILTFKGPRQAGALKSREEIQTGVADARALEGILLALGYRRTFRSQKFREEYALGEAQIAVDETPLGVFIEIEAPPDDIDRAARKLGRGPDDYELESYPGLWRLAVAERGLTDRDMLFDSVQGDGGPS